MLRFLLFNVSINFFIQIEINAVTNIKYNVISFTHESNYIFVNCYGGLLLIIVRAIYVNYLAVK